MWLMVSRSQPLPPNCKEGEVEGAWEVSGDMSVMEGPCAWQVGFTSHLGAGITTVACGARCVAFASPVVGRRNSILGTGSQALCWRRWGRTR